jgi:hypothetical protein
MDTSQTQLVVKDNWNTCVPAGPHPLRHRDELLTYRAEHSVVKGRSSLVHRMNEPASRGALSRLRMWPFAGLSTGRRPGAGHPGRRLRSTACLRSPTSCTRSASEPGPPRHSGQGSTMQVRVGMGEAWVFRQRNVRTIGASCRPRSVPRSRPWSARGRLHEHPCLPSTQIEK